MNGVDDTYIIGGAGLPMTTTARPFDREYNPRGFQSQALEWMYADGTPPVAGLIAPTGAGKTDVIAALGEVSEQLLCVYPTNALINSQQKALEEAGLDVKIVTGDTLSGSGADRSRNLLKIAQAGQRAGGQDVVITNPDVLQASIQNLYFSPGSRILNIFAQFDAAVYDEFHYYDPLAASGLLTQIKILSERGSVLTLDGKELPKFLLSSATPNAQFLEYIRDDLDLDLQEIRAELHSLDIGTNPDAPAVDERLVFYTVNESKQSGPAIPTPDQFASSTSPSDAFSSITGRAFDSGSISRFRYPILIRRYNDRIGPESFGVMADSLAETIRDEYEGGGPIAAVIFNSAAKSNAFQKYLVENRPSIADLVTKDNGYDTNAGRTIPDETVALNTTSKGEVGLNFDIRRLIVANPFTAMQFIQRVGRAARQSPAIVDLYGLNDPGWPSFQSYSQFLRRVIQMFSDVESWQKRLRHLVGMRAAYALHDRIGDEVWHNESIFDDFRGFPLESKWETFFKELDEAEDTLNDDSWMGTTLSRETSDMIRGACAARHGLRSLRGRTISHPITYPRGGGGFEDTEYSLLSALMNYSIDSVGRNDHLYLTDEQTSGPLRGYYSGNPNGGDGIDLMQPRFIVTEKLRDGYKQLVATTDDLTAIPIDESDLELFFTIMPVYAALVPTRLRAGRFEFDLDTHIGEVENIASRE